MPRLQLLQNLVTIIHCDSSLLFDLFQYMDVDGLNFLYNYLGHHEIPCTTTFNIIKNHLYWKSRINRGEKLGVYNENIDYT